MKTKSPAMSEKDKSAKNEAALERNRFKRWILKSTTTDSGDQNGVTFHHVRKFVDAKQTGASSKPEFKQVLQGLLDRGQITKNGGRIAMSAGSPSKRSQSKRLSSAKKKSAKKDVKRRSASKVAQ